MSQHDLNITNQTHTNFRQDLNNALEAIASKQSGTGDPAITYPFQEKIDTSASPAVVYIRKSSNDAWVRIGYIDATSGQLIMDDATDADTVDGKHYSDFSDKLVYDVTLAGTDTYTGTLPSGVSDYYDKMKYIFYVPNANTGANPTINLSSKGAKKVLDRNGAAISIGDLIVGRAVCEYDSYADGGSGGWLLLNPKSSSAEVGEVSTFAMNTAPAGWLECNGAAISRTTYSALFTAIGTTFGIGDGSTTFNLPDLRGEFVRGWDHSRGVDAGRTFGSAQDDMFEAHNHTIEGFSYSYFSDGGSGALKNISGNYPVSQTGGSETRPRNIALLYCIKY